MALPKLPVSLGRKYEQLLFLQILLLDCNFSFDLGKEVKLGDKFDDIVRRYTEKSIIFYEFYQLKHVENGGKKILTHNDLIGINNAPISIEKNDFNLKKYFASFLRISNQFYNTNNVIKALILYTNVKDVEDKNFFNNDKIINDLLSIKCDFDLLAELLAKYTDDNYANSHIMTLDDPLIRYYHLALLEERILQVIPQETKKKNTFKCRFHPDFINNTSNYALKLKILEKCKTMNLKTLIRTSTSWNYAKGFGVGDDKNKIRLPVYTEINQDIIKQFFSVFQLRTGQPGVDQLEKNVQIMFKEKFFSYINGYEIYEMFNEWRNKRKQNEDWIEINERDEFLKNLQKQVIIGDLKRTSNELIYKFQSIWKQFDIQIDFWTDLNEFLENNVKCAFVQTENVFFTLLKLINVGNNVFLINIKDLFNLSKISTMDCLVIVICDNTDLNENAVRLINARNEKFLFLGAKNNYEYQIRDESLINFSNIRNCEMLLLKTIQFQEKQFILKESVTILPLIDCTLLQKLLENELIHIGKDLVDEKFCETDYISRTLTKQSIKQDILKENFQHDVFIVDDLNLFQNTCDTIENKNIHFLLRKENVLIWQFSKGSIKNLFRYKIANFSYGLVEENDIFSQFSNNKLIIISGVAGTGKSSILSNFYNKLKSRFTIIRINLQEYDAIFNKIKNINEINAIELLLNLLKTKKNLYSFELNFISYKISVQGV